MKSPIPEIFYEKLFFKKHRLIFFSSQKIIAFFISLFILINWTFLWISSSNLFSLFYAFLIFLNISWWFVIFVLLLLLFHFYNLRDLSICTNCFFPTVGMGIYCCIFVPSNLLLSSGHSRFYILGVLKFVMFL